MPPKKATAAAAGGDAPALARTGSTGNANAGSGSGKKTTDDQAEDVLLNYLIKQNRPYNATDLQANLKAKHNISKPAVVKALASLAQKGDIVEKMYGKQAIYAPKQPEETVSGEDMERLRTELAEKKAKLKEINDAQKELSSQMTALESAPTTKELPGKIAKLKTELESQSAHLTSLKSDPSMLLSKADITAIDASFATIKKIWITRRKAGLEACNVIVDAKGLTKSEQKEFLEEEIGIENDSARLEELLKPPQANGTVLGKRKAV